ILMFITSFGEQNITYKCCSNFLIHLFSFRTLSNTLKELERDELIIRKEYPQIPPKVEYRLSERGQSLIPLLDMMCDWGERNKSS
ncbi:winged helix-turn-helix transcriptional regulator, partial [Acinetobacter pittii]|uniref:winged helix-turn-helix transcriptional regulator n=1 Tax=Acinetobacter pittii TaxID=48296 RepID=UPI0021D02AC8